MTAWYYVKQAWQRWLMFDGRARRKEYWYFALVPVAFVFVLMIVAAIVIPNMIRANQDASRVNGHNMPWPVLPLGLVTVPAR